MSEAAAYADLRQEHLTTLRNAIETSKREAKDQGATKSIALALDFVELVIRSQKECLNVLRRMQAIEVDP